MLKQYVKKLALEILSFGLSGKLNDLKHITWMGLGMGYGDIFIILAVPREIKKIFKDSVLTFASNVRFTDFMRHEKNIDLFYNINFVYDSHSIRTLKFYTNLILTVRQCKTELLFLFTGWLPFFVLPLLRFAGVKHVVMSGNEKLSNSFVSFYGDYDPYVPVRNLIKKALAPIGCENLDLRGEFYITKENKLKAEKILSDKFKENCNKEFLFFNPEGSEEHRCLSFIQIVETVKILHKIFPSYYIIVSKYKMRLPDLAKETLQYASIVDINDIFVLIAIMEKAVGIISVDTSTVHIADILDKPLVAMYSAKYWHSGKKMDPPELIWRSPRSSTVSLYSDNINDISPEQIAYAMKESMEKMKQQKIHN